MRLELTFLSAGYRSCGAIDLINSFLKTERARLSKSRLLVGKLWSNGESWIRRASRRVGDGTNRPGRPCLLRQWHLSPLITNRQRGGASRLKSISGESIKLRLLRITVSESTRRRPGEDENYYLATLLASSARLVDLVAGDTPPLLCSLTQSSPAKTGSTKEPRRESAIIGLMPTSESSTEDRVPPISKFGSPAWSDLADMLRQELRQTTHFKNVGACWQTRWHRWWKKWKSKLYLFLMKYKKVLSHRRHFLSRRQSHITSYKVERMSQTGPRPWPSRLTSARFLATDLEFWEVQEFRLWSGR